jgi:hypothetical protein
MGFSTVRYATLGALCWLGACADATSARISGPLPTEPQAPIAPRGHLGTWRATTLNGVALPALFRTGVVGDSSASASAQFVFVDSANVLLRADGQYTQTVYYTEWAGALGTGPTHALYSDVAVDAGHWEYTSTGALLLRSIYLVGRRINGTIIGDAPHTLRLQHGITVGPVEGTFEYRR